MYRCFVVLFWLSVAHAAQIAAPDIGFVRTGDGEMRQVAGLQSSFVVGPALQKSVASASFSDAGGIAVMADEIAVVNPSGLTVAAYGSSDPAGIAGISTGLDTAIAWLPGNRELVWFDGTAFHTQTLTADLPCPVLALRRNGNTALLLLNEGQTVLEASVSLTTGDLLNTELIPDVAPPAIYSGTQVMAGENLHLACTPTVIEPMASAWLHAWCQNGSEWAVRLTNGTAQSSELPHPVPVRHVQSIGPHSETAR